MNARTLSLRRLLADDAVPDATPDATIGGVACDSRLVRPGDLFVALRGAAFDGHDFAADAVAGGAVAVVSERPLALSVPNVVVADAGARVGAWGRRFFGAPSSELAVIGVTGTNGKTTVARHIAGLVERGGYMGTLGWGMGAATRPSARTTADAVTVQARLRALKDRGAALVALEASSHALRQGRVDAVDFAGAVFTNLTRDHLDYHGTMREYGDAKRRLFKRPLDFAVVNVDDALGREIAAALPAGVESVGYGRDAAVRWSDLRYSRAGVAGVLRTPWGNGEFALPGFFGEFSVYNAAAAVAASCATGVPLAAALTRLRRMSPVAGRMQQVWSSPRVLVDFAHTPDALRAALAAARSHLAEGARLVVAFGCGGERDRGKRPLMARAAEAGADIVVATSDNPRGEDAGRILHDVMAGFQAPGKVLRIPDRRAAIAAAVRCADKDDIVLLAGKGHERYQELGARKLPFDEAAIVRELFDNPVAPTEPGNAGASEGEARCCFG